MDRVGEIQIRRGTSKIKVVYLGVYLVTNFELCPFFLNLDSQCCMQTSVLSKFNYLEYNFKD